MNSDVEPQILEDDYDISQDMDEALFVKKDAGIYGNQYEDTLAKSFLIPKTNNLKNLDSNERFASTYSQYESINGIPMVLKRPNVIFSSNYLSSLTMNLPIRSRVLLDTGAQDINVISRSHLANFLAFYPDLRLDQKQPLSKVALSIFPPLNSEILTGQSATAGSPQTAAGIAGD